MIAAALLFLALPLRAQAAELDIGGKSAVLSAVQSVQMCPIVVILISLYTFYRQWGMLNTYRGVILADVTFALPLSITLLKSFFDTVPQALDESAKIDGATNARSFWQIVMPNIKPAWLTLLLFSFSAMWSYQPSGTIFDETLKTLPNVMSQISNGGIARSGSAMAASVILMLLVTFNFV